MTNCSLDTAEEMWNMKEWRNGEIIEKGRKNKERDRKEKKETKLNQPKQEKRKIHHW